MLEGIRTKWLASRSKTLMVFCSCVLIACAAWSWPDKRCESDEVCRYNGSLVSLAGRIAAEPDRRMGETRYIVRVNTLDGAAVTGRVLLSAKQFPEYEYGDIVEIECVLQKPEQAAGGFRYDKYLATQNVFSTCAWPKLVQRTGHESGVVGYLFAFKNIIAAKIGQLWPEPAASFMAGLLYGSRSGLPEDITLALRATGITHIVAVSGFNISIIVQSLVAVLVALGMWRRSASWCAGVVVVVFVIFTGASASVVRAGCMGLLTLAGGCIGRPVHAERILLLAATGMALANPFVVLWDIGFQLSFLSTAGLMVIGPVCKQWGLDRLGVVGEVLIATLSAHIATLPLILYYFGQLSLVAPLVNVLVLWSIPWIMLLGFVALIASFVSLPLSLFVAWAGYLGVTYVLGVAVWFGRQPWAATQFPLTWWMMVSWYIVIGIMIYGQKNKSNNA